MMLPQFYVDDVIKRSIEEDINYIDLATDLLLDDDKKARAEFVAKDDGIIAGIDIALRVFRLLDDTIVTERLISDGTAVKKGDIISSVEGSVKTILKGERTALNLLNHLSGVATATGRLVAEAKKYGKARIVDTRKTTPGLRALEKYAVTAGGGFNHRFNLSDAAMLKDNHIDAYGSITKAVQTLRSKIGHMAKIEVEARTMEDMLEAIECGADVIMLDNMNCEQMAECVKVCSGRAVLEASGNIDINTVGAVAATGVDIISSGAITHSAKVLDISLKIRK
ncbi:MAG: carboxylating nicotinate-nucleotide diphosphorylase [Oscillospiraceae bacterium]|nr:carboxylating nicotinate-nucleotide diphosphorylase [Oscillospiraceae bacterium]